MAVSFLSNRLKAQLKGQAKCLRQRYIRLVYGFGCEDLARMLTSLGVERNAVLMVHSSFDRFEGFEGKVTDVIAMLQEMVGEGGAILMPTIPFAGTAVAYARTAGVFDATRTPSRMGLITEIFRRMPGVERSVHPTHSVAGWGRRSLDLLCDHHAARTPCGQSSPFGRLPDVGGKVLLLGASIDSMTLFHSIEEMLEPVMPFSPFTTEVFHLTCRDREGCLFETKTRLFDPEVSRRRNLERLVPWLKARGWWHEARVGTLRVILLDAREVADTCRAMADEGIYCYD